MPGGSKENLKLPLASVVAERVCCVSLLVSNTVALGTDAPEGSVTVPVNAPVDDDCDHAEGANAHNPIIKERIPRTLQTTQFGFMSIPPIFLLGCTILEF